MKLDKESCQQIRLDSPYVLKYTTVMKTSTFSLLSDLKLRNKDEELLTHKSVKLLENIIVYGSISKAAKALGVTYKTAWGWIDKMNRLSPRPLVQKISGGKDGGGTVVTSYAKELISIYEEVEALQHKHLHTLESSFSHLQEDDQDRHFAFSRLEAEVKEIIFKGEKAVFLLALPCGSEISAQTPASFAQVNKLDLGKKVSVLIEADSISVTKSFEKEISSRNKLNVTVDEIRIDEDDVLLALRLCEGHYLTARITHRSYSDLKIKKSDELMAVFKAYSVTLFMK